MVGQHEVHHWCQPHPERALCQADLGARATAIRSPSSPRPAALTQTIPKRARNADGTYRGDDPETPDTNEAWEGGEPPAKGKRKGKKR